MSTEKAKGRKPKSKSRTKNELCIEKAEMLVSKTENFLKSAQDLKDKINVLPGGNDFSKIAIGYNNLIDEAITTLTTLPFEVTEKEEMDSVSVKTGKTFADYQKEKPSTEEIPDDKD